MSADTVCIVIQKAVVNNTLYIARKCLVILPEWTYDY